MTDAPLAPSPVPEIGKVTAGNSSGINDGSAGLIIMSAEKAEELSIRPIARIKAVGRGGCHPSVMGLSPVPAVNQLMQNSHLKLEDFELIEVNEAFAAQAIGCMRELGIENDRPNELGSGISLGHPIGCTGTRQMVTAMNQMKRKSYQTGLITMCIGGGMGAAAAAAHCSRTHRPRSTLIYNTRRRMSPNRATRSVIKRPASPPLITR